MDLFSLIYDNSTLIFICYNKRKLKVIDMKRFACSLILSSALLSSSVLGATYDDGLAAYKMKAYDKAVILFSKSVKEDKDARSKRNLGIMYASGVGVVQDFDKAVKLLKQASNSGDAYAGFSLGNMYAQGDGVKKDFKEAAIWFDKSAKKGNPQAAYNLAYLYTYGDGVKKNFNKAYELYKQAAMAGNINAQINLTFIYISAQGVKKDMKQAAFWAKKVLDTGDERVKQMWKEFELEKFLEKKSN